MTTDEFKASLIKIGWSVRDSGAYFQRVFDNKNRPTGMLIAPSGTMKIERNDDNFSHNYDLTKCDIREHEGSKGEIEALTIGPKDDPQNRIMFLQLYSFE